MIHQTDLPVLRAVKSYAGNYGFPMYTEAPARPHSLNEGDEFYLGRAPKRVLFVPGHSPGHCFLFWEQKKVFFRGCFISNIALAEPICRWWFWYAHPKHSSKLFTFRMMLLCLWSWPTTTIGGKVSNPFCANPSLTNGETYPQRVYFRNQVRLCGHHLFIHQSRNSTEWFVWAACVFDFWMVCCTNFKSVQFDWQRTDSLADMVSFGLLPGIVMKIFIGRFWRGFWSWLGFCLPFWGHPTWPTVQHWYTSKRFIHRRAYPHMVFSFVASLL